MVAGIRSYLAAADVDVQPEIERGALILSSDQSHLVKGDFDADRMIQLLIESIETATRDGYVGIFVTGDMNWEFGSEKNFDKLLRYERKLEELFVKYPCLSGICQYHRDMLPHAAIHYALTTHPDIFVNETLALVNPYYVREEDAAVGGLSDAQIASRVKHLYRFASRAD